MKFLIVATLVAAVAALFFVSAAPNGAPCPTATCDVPPPCQSFYYRCLGDNQCAQFSSWCSNGWCNTTSCKTDKCEAECSQETCDAAINFPNCTAATNPYVCEAGIAKNGCFAQPPVHDVSCRKCCNLQSCKRFKPKCTECPQNMCWAPQCDPTGTDPYACTAGHDAGGCGPSSEYWSQHPGCLKCCYCPKTPPKQFLRLR